MKTCIITLSIFVLTLSKTDAFMKHGIQRAAAPAAVLTSSTDTFANANANTNTNTNKVASLSCASRLNMVADDNNTNDGQQQVTTIIDKDFRLAAIFLVIGLLLDTIPYLQLTLGPLITVLGVLFLVQTFRLNFVCDNDTFSLQDSSQESGENIVVGGENKWTYDSFVNYDFFPNGWIDQPQGPILVYFKETQTPEGKKSYNNTLFFVCLIKFDSILIR
jgi:hypothetical protein